MRPYQTRRFGQEQRANINDLQLRLARAKASKAKHLIRDLERDLRRAVNNANY